MEDNQFAVFSFSGPTRRTPLRACKLVSKKGGDSSLVKGLPRSVESPHEVAIVEAVVRRGEKVKVENASDCALDSMVTLEGGRNPKHVLRSGTSEEHLPSVFKVEKVEEVEEHKLLVQMVDAIHVKEECQETVDSFSAPLCYDSPFSAVNKRRLPARNSGRGDGTNLEEIEDCGGALTCRTVDHVEVEEKKVSMKRRIRKGSKSGLSEIQSPPPDWNKALENIRIMRTGRNAPVDLLGPEQLVDTTADLETQKFHVLVAAMISSQTRDSVTAAAMRRLQAVPGGLTIQNLVESNISLETLEELLKPVLYYRQKAKHLKSMADILLKPPYCGSVPRTLDALMKLPGVGPKVGLLVLWVGFGMGEVGLIVDTNVRRVCCRLGWVPEGSTAEKVRQELELWLPKNLWAEISFLFVGFGQQICKPVGPKCEECGVKSFCPSAFKYAKKVIRKKV